MAELEVIKIGNPKLRMNCALVDVADIQTEDFQAFLNSMRETMHLENGVGIAAPQVGVLQRFFIMEMQGSARYPDKKSFSLLVAINPEIEVVGDELQDSWEGCLSIPNMRGKLKRHKHIKLSALDQNGNAYTLELTDFPAIVAQHELDHLNGVMFVDRMESMETLSCYDEYQEYWQEGV